MLENKKLIYITPLNFRTCFANQIQVLSMAQAFSQLLGNGFILVCSGEENENLSKIPHHIVNPPFFKRFFSIYYYSNVVYPSKPIPSFMIDFCTRRKRSGESIFKITIC